MENIKRNVYYTFIKHLEAVWGQEIKKQDSNWTYKRHNGRTSAIWIQVGNIVRLF